jgi:hypothetical protein
MAQVLMTAQVPPTIDVTREERPMGYATRHHRASGRSWMAPLTYT